MNQKQTDRLSKIVTACIWILVALLLAASGFLLWISNYTGDSLRLGNQVLYLTDHNATGASDKSNCLLFVSDRAPKIGDLILLQLEDQSGNLFYSVSSVRSLNQDSLLVYDGLLDQEFSLRQQDTLGVVTASSHFLGMLLRTLSAPEKRMPIFISIGCIFLLIFSALTIVILLGERKRLSPSDSLSETAEKLYEIIPEQPETKSSQMQIEDLIEQEDVPLILEKPSEPSLETNLPDPPVSNFPKTEADSPPKLEAPAVPDLEPAEDISSVHYLEHIDSEPINITMTNEELEALKTEILNLQKESV